MGQAVALVGGYLQRDIYLTLWIGLGGAFLTMLVVVPPWPAYNKNPQLWLPSGKGLSGLPEGGIVVGGKKVK